VDFEEDSEIAAVAEVVFEDRLAEDSVVTAVDSVVIEVGFVEAEEAFRHEEVHAVAEEVRVVDAVAVE